MCLVKIASYRANIVTHAHYAIAHERNYTNADLGLLIHRDTPIARYGRVAPYIG